MSLKEQLAEHLGQLRVAAAWVYLASLAKHLLR